MLLTTQQWLGTTWTISPTWGRSAQAERSTMPCSSERLPTTASGYSKTWPKPFCPYWSEVNTLVPQSRMARPSVGRLTTVARTRMAQLSQVAVPEETTMTSLNTQVPARCSVSMERFCAVKSAAVPPPETTGTGIPAPLKSARARSKNSRVVGSRLGKVMRPRNCMRGSRAARRARSKTAAGVCTPVRPNPVSHSTRNRTSTPWRAPASLSPRATTSLSRTTASPGARRHRAIRRSVLAWPRMLKVSRMSSAMMSRRMVTAGVSRSFTALMGGAPVGSSPRSDMGMAAVLHAEDVHHLAQADELRKYPGQLQALLLAEEVAELFPKGVVHPVVVEEQAIGIAERRLLARGEGPALVVGEGRHQLLGDALAPSQGVARGHSVGAIVELGQAQPRQLLSAMLHQAFADERRVEGNEALEGLGQAREGEDEVRIAALGLPAIQHEV